MEIRFRGRVEQKLGETARKSAFPSGTVFEGISGSKSEQPHTDKDNRRQAVKPKGAGIVEREKTNQGSDRTSESTRNGYAKQVPQGAKIRESKTQEGELGTNSGQRRIAHGKMGTNTEQTGIFRGHDDEIKGQSDLFQGPNTEKLRRVQDTNINLRKWIASQRATVGQPRTTEGETGTNTGQSGTSERQAGTSGTSSENAAVEQENAEISNSSPGMQK